MLPSFFNTIVLLSFFLANEVICQEDIKKAKAHGDDFLKLFNDKLIISILKRNPYDICMGILCIVRDIFRKIFVK